MEKFTHNKIANLSAEKNRYHITEGNGFCLRVSPKGTKTWFYRYKFSGKEKWLTIGNFPVMGVAEARKAFNDLWEIRQAGQDPEEIIQQKLIKKNNNVSTLISDWYNNYIAKHRKQPQQIKQQIDADIIPLLGKKELEKLQPRDITQALDSIVKRGSPIHANKVLSTLKQVFNYGVSRGELSSNPAASIRSRDIGGLEKPRERFLTSPEINILWQFLDSNSNKISFPVLCAIKIILLTGIRTGEILLAQWDEINFEQSLWTIPASHNKNALIMRVHLSPLCKNLFKQLLQTKVSPYIISNIRTGAPLSEKTIAKAVSRIQERVGIPHWTPHDLRRTFATQLGETLDIDPIVIEKCLGHKMPKIMATYNKNEMLPQRKDALNKWSQYIETLVCSENENYHIPSFLEELI
jgi:integrase